MNNRDLPLSFVMALAQNGEAMKKYSALTEPQKQDIIRMTRNVKSKQQMRSFVDNMFEFPTI